MLVEKAVDAEWTSELRAKVKGHLRQRMRSLRAAHPADQLAARSAKIVVRVAELIAFKDAESLALFWPNKGEVDLRGLDQIARGADKRVYYPFMDPAGQGRWRTGFRRVLDGETPAVRGRGFAEPNPDNSEAASGELELIIVPALGVSEGGCRLGYGGGFYDSTLPEFLPRAKIVVVAYDFQWLIELPTMSHDIACHLVVTDQRVATGAP